MTTEEFWKIYMNGDILEMYNDVKTFFSQPLPKEFLKDYDYGEVILETMGHHESDKQYDKVLEFTLLLQEKHPRIYKEYHEYFDDFLIDFYCFHGQFEKNSEAIKYFLKNPVKGVDEFFKIFDVLLFYKQVDLVDLLASRTYQPINSSREIMPGAAMELAIAKSNLELEKHFSLFLENGEFDWKTFNDCLSKFGFNFSVEFINSLEKGLTSQTLQYESLSENLNNGENKFVAVLQGYFQKKMLVKGFNFVLSGRIFNEILEFWWDNQSNKAKITLEKFFAIDYDSFKKFIDRKSGSFLDYSLPDIAMIIWGSQFVYDFLHNEKLISENIYLKSLEIIRVFKGRFIRENFTELWKFNYVHCWGKDDSIDDQEFEAEKRLFEKSYPLKPAGWKENALKKYYHVVKEEVDQLINLKPFLTESYFQDNKDHEIKNKWYFDDDDLLPTPILPKVGRNDPCPCGSGKKYKHCCWKN